MSTAPPDHPASPDARADRSYLSAVADLNGLQTNYEIIQQIKASGGRINEYSIPEFEAFVEKIGHSVDELDALNVIHVTGTKGKGSTCAFVSSILRQVDSPRPLRIGLFTSPHLIEVRERIQINGEPISQELFAKYFYQTYDGLKSDKTQLRLVTKTSPSMPMYFRFLTLMAFHAFLAERVDVAIMEVGVGGLYDSTNVIRRPVVCGIASLGIDHEAALGSTIEEIARHKAGIIKQGVPVFTVPQVPPALEVIEKQADSRNAPLAVVQQVAQTQALGIPGDHQRTNAALASALCRQWLSTQQPSTPSSTVSSWIATGLAQAAWPGRSQSFVSPRYDSLTWHVDGAHTVESMAACARWFAALEHPAKCVLLFNAAHNRSAQALLQVLWQNAAADKKYRFVDAVFCPNLSARADSVNFTVQNDAVLGPQHQAAGEWQKLAAAENDAVTHVLPTINDAVRYIEETYGGNNAAEPVHVLATGSLHLVGGVLDTAKGSV